MRLPLKPPPQDSGFTLLEVLAALVVLGFLMTGLTQGTRFGLRALDRQVTRAAMAGDLEAVDRVLRRLVEALDPGNAREPPVIQGSRNALRMVTDLGAAAAALGEGAAEVQLSVQGGQLVMLWAPARHVVPLGPKSPPQRAVLLEGVAGLDLAYWGAEEGAPPSWQPTWAQPALPLLVRVRLIFPEGSARSGLARRWPDIVAAPRRERDGG